jgi:hypothetical protein
MMLVIDAGGHESTFIHKDLWTAESANIQHSRFWNWANEGKSSIGWRGMHEQAAADSRSVTILWSPINSTRKVPDLKQGEGMSNAQRGFGTFCGRWPVARLR